ncbi:MFS transporter [Rhodovastum atsumiense]|uniref:MFS transporter n=1 Tax=Rhodovastum atsumiense TaxID=504468 RepID=A0A5M6IYG5_9PROT|nr:MFS transporter [Rhodovastum atsumiense]KAA5612408.1 MFS transporter [Rhodovastum atsumiense]CAH2600314.1 MFS transporter [Rhodovastum atsumiense]
MHAPSAGPGAFARFFQQPRAVWATAFAATIGFTSIGLVDPILTSIAAGLNARPSQVSLLFTSYFAVTAAMMLVTGYVSSRLGGRGTLLLGAGLIAVFAALAGTSTSVAELVGFRAGWGLGNALFVVTALSVIVRAANGGTATAILLYEAALGLGLSVGPLIGAALGDLSWRYPFFGTATLMAIGFVAIALFLPAQPKPPVKSRLVDPLKALTHRGLAATAVSAFFYNYAFFTVLAFVPFVLQLSPHAVGVIFFGWGVMLALFSVLVAPRLQARFSPLGLLSVVLLLLALLLVGMAFGDRLVVAIGVVLAGALMGLNNTVYTEMALEVSPAQRPIASAAYNFVRWFAGVIAPYAAPLIAEHSNARVSFLVAAAGAAIAPVVLWGMRRHLGRFAAPPTGEAPPVRKVIAAVDGSATDPAVLARARLLAADRGAPVEVVHVRSIEVFADQSAAEESRAGAEALVQAAVATLRADGIPVEGTCLEDIAARAPLALLCHAEASGAYTIVLGTRHTGDLSDLVHGSFADTVRRNSPVPVELVPEPAPAAAA